MDYDAFVGVLAPLIDGLSDAEIQSLSAAIDVAERRVKTELDLLMRS